MSKNRDAYKPIIIDICERLIEDAQTKLMFQTKPSNRITLNLSNYMGPNDDLRRLKKDIVAFLIDEEIRLYEDESDEDGNITASEEKYTKIFKEVSINESINFYTLINLVYSDYMMDLLT